MDEANSRITMPCLITDDGATTKFKARLLEEPYTTLAQNMRGGVTGKFTHHLF
jgi:hypothetical protein